MKTDRFANPVEYILLFPLHRWGDWGAEKLSPLYTNEHLFVKYPVHVIRNILLGERAICVDFRYPNKTWKTEKSLLDLQHLGTE